VVVTPPGSHDAVGEVLEAVVQLGGDGPHGAVHQLLHQQLQLLLRQRHVEPLLQAADGAGAVEAGQVGTWRTWEVYMRKVYMRKVYTR